MPSRLGPEVSDTFERSRSLRLSLPSVLATLISAVKNRSTGVLASRANVQSPALSGVGLLNGLPFGCSRKLIGASLNVYMRWSIGTCCPDLLWTLSLIVTVHVAPVGASVGEIGRMVRLGPSGQLSLLPLGT